MLGSEHLNDGSVHDIVGAGDVRLSLLSGASYLLRHVCYVPDMPVSLISIGQSEIVDARFCFESNLL